MAVTFVQLDSFEKKMYRVHQGIYAKQSDEHVLEVARFLARHGGSTALGDGLRVATAGELRRRKLTVA